MTQIPRSGDSAPEGDLAAARQATRRVVNVRLLVLTLVAAAVVGPALYWWRSRQAERIADALLGRAEALQRAEQWEAAAGHLTSYLRLRPLDAAARARLAQACRRSARSPAQKWRSVELYYQALGALGGDAPSSQVRELRVELAELLLELSDTQSGCSTLAEREALLLLAPADKALAWQRIRAGDPALPLAAPQAELWWADHPSVWEDALGARLWVRAIEKEVADGSWKAKASGKPPYLRHFERAWELNPGEVELSIILARMYRNQPQLLVRDEAELTPQRRGELAAAADRIIDEMVARNPKNPQALLARHQYRTAYQQTGAEEDLRESVRCGPDDLAVLLSAGRHAQEQAERMKREGLPPGEVEARFDEACAFCRRAIEVAPTREEGYLALGNALRARGQDEKAIAVWREGLARSAEEGLTLRSRLVETLIAMGRLDEAQKNLDALDRAATRLLPQLTRDGQRWLGGLRNLLRGRLLLEQGRCAEAIGLLRRATVAHESSDQEITQARQAWQLLGGLYAGFGQWDLAASAHEAAAKQTPAQPSAEPELAFQSWLAAADAWMRAGCAAMAAADYEAALAIKDDPQVWVLLAQARLQAQTGLAPAASAWDSFDKALAQAKARRGSLAEPWRVALLEANALTARAGAPEARQQAVAEAAKLLRQAESEYPDSQPLLQTLVLTYDRLGLSADADRALDRFERLVGESAASSILRAQLCVRRKQYDQARHVLAKGWESLPPEAHAELQAARLQVALEAGQIKEAYQQLLELHKGSPGDAGLVWQLAELAAEQNDLQQLARWEEKLHELEGPEGSCWRYWKARRLVAQAGRADDPRLAEAAELQRHIESQRRAWPPGYELAGLLAERAGRTARAIEAYVQAVQLGERRISIWERLIALLCQTRRFDEAAKYLAPLYDHLPSSPTLSGLYIQVAIERGDLERALCEARRGVETSPQDPMARVWLGRVLLRSKAAEEAEAALREAARLAPDDRRVCDALIGFYVDTGRPDQAREVLARLAANPQLAEAERSLALAEGYQRIGDRVAAENQYRNLAQRFPNDAAAQKRLAAFLLHSDPEAAEQALRRALRLAPDDGETRRALALILANRGGLTAWQEAERLVSQGGSGKEDASLDRRLYAQLLVQRGGKQNLAKATQLLEQLVQDPHNAAPEDHLLLAELYEGEGKLYAAEQEYSSLVKQAEPQPAHVILLAEFLLRHDRLSDAERWLKRLDTELPDWLARLEPAPPDRLAAVRRQTTLDATRVRAQWLGAQGRDSEIKPLVEQVAARLLQEAGEAAEKKADVYRSLGDLCTAEKQHGQAEHWYQLLADLAPEQYEPLVMAKARQGRAGEGVRLCIQAAQSDSSAQPAIVMAKMLASTQPSPEDLALAEPFLTEAVAKHSENTALLAWTACVRSLQKRTDEAARLYRLVLERNPGQVSVINNLAVLLAEQPPRRQEALDYVDRAIDIAGPKPWLLDTKGTILLLDGQAAQAVPLLEEASALAPDPRHLLHLAAAYHRTGEPAKARDALAKARNGNLAGQVLTEADRSLLAELEAIAAP